ncbi:MAG: hypothetical protein F6K41_29780 [Symploca sp. SIO3E6]|nr:hypothetical protein [Caldora sp. SIO3E6]
MQSGRKQEVISIRRQEAGGRRDKSFPYLKRGERKKGWGAEERRSRGAEEEEYNFP